MRRIVLTVLASGVVFLASSDVSAAGRRFLSRGQNAEPEQVATPQPAAGGQQRSVWVQPGGGPYRPNPYYQYRAMYPKYYWGLHARTYQNIGIPNGDIGLRGNGITPYPW